MAQDPWAAFEEVTPQSAPAYPGIIPGRPKAPDAFAIEDQRRENDRFAFDQQKFAWERQQAEEKAARETVEAEEKASRLRLAQGGAVSKLLRVIDKIDQVAIDAYDNGGWGETGFTGSLLRNVPGTAAKDLAANIQTIDANSAFSALQEMREASPTGGALGQVTEKELDLLKSSISNLDPNQSQEQFLQNLGSAKQAYLDMLRRLDPEAAEAANLRAGIQFRDDGRVVVSPTAGHEREPINPFNVPPPEGPSGGSGFDFVMRGIAEGAGDLVEGAASLPGLIINPVGQALYDVAGYDARYDFGDILRGTLGLPESKPGLGRSMRQGTAAALTGGIVARAAAPLFTGVTRGVLSNLGATPIRDSAAGAGAAGGGEIGREIGGEVGQIVGILGGGMTGYGSAGALNAFGQTARNFRSGTPSALAAAAERQGVDLLPADAGGPVARAITTGTKASPVSVAPVVNAAKAQQEQFGAAVQRAASREGEIVTSNAAGEALREGAKKYSIATAEAGSRLYDRAAKMARNVKAIRPVRTIAAVDAAIARAEQNPAAPRALLESLKTFRAKVADGVTIQGLRDARTSLSEGVYDGQLRGGSEQKMWKDILGNVAQDIDEGLRSVGRDNAADMFRAADDFWSKRVEQIDTVLQPIIGKDGMRGGEEVLRVVESMARGGQGGAVRLSKLIGAMPEKDARQVRAVIVDRLGRAAPGAQNAEGTAFSAATFLTNWNKMTPQAKAALFPSGQLRADLNDLALLAEGMKASQAMANHSNTAVAVGSNAAIGATAFLAHPALTAVGAGAQYLTGKLMASPRFARALARTAKMSPAAARRTLSEQLGVIAGRDALVAADARGLQQFLNDAVSRSPQRAAAEDESNRR